MSLRFPLIAMAAVFVTALGVPVARAQDAAATTTGMPVSAVKSDLSNWVKYAEDKIIELAEVTPEAKYAWKPGKGVRTQGEIFMHVAAANYGVPSFAGVTPPEGFKFDGYEKSMTKKDDIVKALKDSFVHLHKAIDNTPDGDWEKQVKLFGSEMSTRSMYMLLLTHAHEHLGQSIAYARSNGITPPWTAREQQAAQVAEKDKKDKEKK
jgi:hypothetical protein